MMNDPIGLAPDVDPELAVSFANMIARFPAKAKQDVVQLLRAVPPPRAEEVIADWGESVDHRTTAVPASGDRPEIALSVFSPIDPGDAGPAPVVVYVHGGGLVGGNRFTGVVTTFPWIVELGLTVVSCEYRRPPEHPYPAPADDVHATIDFVRTTAGDFDVDPHRIVVAASSAGCLPAAGAVLARAQTSSAGGLVGQLLMAPMLDDSDASVSTRQYESPTSALWDRGVNRRAWRAYRGPNGQRSCLPDPIAPGRHSVLNDLPATFIDCGSAELFREEAIAYARAIWAGGGRCELHVWQGGHHGFDYLAPDAALSRNAARARVAWLRRLIDQT